MCLRKLKRFSLLFLFLFSLPIIIGQFPFPNNEMTTQKIKSERPHVVYAATEPIDTVPEEPKVDPFDVLLMFTHSHESYKPIVKKTKGMQAVYDEEMNIFSLQEMMQHYLELNGLTPHIVDFDVMTEMKQVDATFHQAYKVARPVLAEYLEGSKYDLVIDFHRDSAPKKVTTLTANNEQYAKIAFVVGAEHPAYEANLAYATMLSEQVNRIVPGVSRGIMKKSGTGVDGVYNQDLATNVLLIELGGIDNTEEELQRTMAILAQAIRVAFVESAA
ncbi:stage II sporulation protein P [Solibacillus sp. FSL W7-1324]|uniref:stage II sporulation protein P n=1 Tax=Solibacillus sp. FSL W7-1324 TaxID=2921701 RepID=UPI0030F67335